MIYVILGLPRSGTSLVASIAHKTGISVGSDFGVIDEHNPEGYFEDIEFLQIMDSYIPSVNPLELKEGNGIREYCEERDKEGNWAIKQHLLAFVWDEFIKACDQDVSIIYVIRDRDESIKSLAKMNGQGEQFAVDYLNISDEYLQKVISTWKGRLLKVEYKDKKVDEESILNFIK